MTVATPTRRWVRFRWPDREGRAHYIDEADEDGFHLACGRIRDMVPSSVRDEPSGNVCPVCAERRTVQVADARGFPGGSLVIGEPVQRTGGVFDTVVKAAVWGLAIGFAVWAGARAARG